MNQRRILVSSLVALAGALALGSAHAQAWPSKPIRIVVPFAAGGPADALARFLTNKMAGDFSQPILIDNKGGAGGTLGSGEVVRSNDGHTFLFSSTGALVITPNLMSNLSYNPERDLVAVGQAVNTPSAIVVSAKSPFKTLGDLVTFAKAHPGKLDFGSAGTGTTTQLGAELLKKEAKISMTHIPYRGAAPAITDLIGGQVQLMVADVPAVVSYVKGGQFKALAVASSIRSDALPDVPTTAELKYPGVVSGTWYGIMAPAKTPSDVIAKLNASLNKVLQQPETLAHFKAQGMQPAGGLPEAFDKFIKAESAKWVTLSKEAGVKLE
ncbi:MAG: tripartite tricarboxylate transporter substrate binding protein [Burkholderiaceae bacterium]|nr:tripartite tricarboxylate transporter substrate binding protein [Rhodoferax sp.]